MSNIYKAFENKKAFIPFVTGGDPDLETTKNLLIAMEKSRCRPDRDRYFPFSDPIAERPGHPGSKPESTRCRMHHR